MVAAAVVGGISTAASIGTSLAGASEQEDALNNASNQQKESYGQTKEFLTKANEKAQGYYDPYEKMGRQAANQLAWEMGTGGGDAGFVGQGQQGALNQNFTQDQYRNDAGYTPMVTDLASLQATPGYQFQLEQGLQSVNNSAAANGSLLSGRQVKAVNDYAQGQAATGYQAAWQRAQQAYQAAFDRNNTSNTNRYSRLQSMANNGQTAAGGKASAELGAGSALAGAATNNGNTQASLSMAQGQNNANMYTGIGNAVNSGLGAYAAYSDKFGSGNTNSNPWSSVNNNTLLSQQSLGFNNGKGY